MADENCRAPTTGASCSISIRLGFRQRRESLLEPRSIKRDVARLYTPVSKFPLPDRLPLYGYHNAVADERSTIIPETFEMLPSASMILPSLVNELRCWKALRCKMSVPLLRFVQTEYSQPTTEATLKWPESGNPVVLQRGHSAPEFESGGRQYRGANRLGYVACYLSSP